MRRVWTIAGFLLAGALAALAPAADDLAEATITDAEGKEVKVTSVRFTAGTKRLTAIGDGPVVLELREPHSTTLKVGIITYVPVSSVESVKYDYDKQVATVAVKGVTEPLAVTLQYKGINVLGFDGTADGKVTKFVGGSYAKGSIKGVTFAGAKPLPARKFDAPWLVQIDQKGAMNPTLRAYNFKFLYTSAGGEEKVVDAAITHKGSEFKIDNSVQSLTPLAVDLNQQTAAIEVQVGQDEKIVVLPLQMEKDGKTVTLAGLLGEVEAGWKLFPIHTIKSMKRAKRD